MACTVSNPFLVKSYSYSTEAYIAKDIMSDFGNFTVSDEVVLYNLDGEAEAKCISFEPVGYVIVNSNNYSIPEFSPENDSPYTNFDKTVVTHIYNGPLSYFTMENGVIYDVRTHKQIDLDMLSYIYSEPPTISTNTNISNIALASVTPRATMTIKTEHTPNTWSTNNYCGLDGCAIILSYLDDHHDDSLLTSSQNNSPALQSYLKTNRYIPNAATDGYDLVNGRTASGINYTGLNDFFSDKGSTIRATQRDFTNSLWETVQNSFTNDIPVLLGTTEDQPISDYAVHWLIAYGYYYHDAYGSKIIVNDGFGVNGVYVTASLTYYDEVVLFN